MIDLHSHILPGLDDGSPDLATSLDMGRMAVADGITTMACTPHIFPGVYDNSGPAIDGARDALAGHLRENGIPLQLVSGADVHIAPDLVAGLRAGRVPGLNGSRYFLFEPPHDVLPPRFEAFTFELLAAGYVPVLTHPERLAWMEQHFALLPRLAAAGVLFQLTAASLTGGFGRRVRALCDRMLEAGLVHLIATDAHNTDRRPPILSQARDLVAGRFGEAYATRLVLTNPMNIIENMVLSDTPRPTAEQAGNPPFWKRIWFRNR